MMADKFRIELHKFDVERVLFAWDGLIAKQQTALFALGVPTMFVTAVNPDRTVSISLVLISNLPGNTALQKQQKVMQILEGIEG